jgi:hypothetical protein
MPARLRVCTGMLPDIIRPLSDASGRTHQAGFSTHAVRLLTQAILVIRPNCAGCKLSSIVQSYLHAVPDGVEGRHIACPGDQIQRQTVTPLSR